MKEKKILSTYKVHFQYKEPFSVLIDPPLLSHKNYALLLLQLKKLLTKLKLFTTEPNDKDIQVIEGQGNVIELAKEKNYIIVTSNHEYVRILNGMIGVPTMTFYNKLRILEINRPTQSYLKEQEKVKLNIKETPRPLMMPRKRKRNNPNPLSCLKKKSNQPKRVAETKPIVESQN